MHTRVLIVGIAPNYATFRDRRGEIAAPPVIVGRSLSFAGTGKAVSFSIRPDH